MLDGATDRKVVLLGVRCWGESPALVRPLMAALARKRVEIGAGREETRRWTLVDWSAATARDTVGEHRGRKYFPECYVERAGVDDAFHAAIDRPGQAVLVLGEAGSGKSSLLARLVDRLTSEEPVHDEPAASRRRSKTAGRDAADDVAGYLTTRGRGDVVLYLSGRKDYEGDRSAAARDLLCSSVVQRAGVRAGVFADLGDFLARLAETAGDDADAGRRDLVSPVDG